MNTLCKAERLNSKLVIEKMFAGGSSRSLSVFPLRVVYMSVDKGMSVSVLISVPKKRFKHAVNRNRVKRQVREAYRKNKSELGQILEAKGYKLSVAFIYLSDELISSDELEEKVKLLLARIAEKVV